MKRFYTVIFLSLGLFTVTSAQNRFWVGPSSGSGGLWSNSSNWSATSGGAGGASVPNSSSFDVIFDGDAVANLDVTGLVLNSIMVTNSSRTTIFTAVGNTIDVNSSTIGNEGLRIDAGSVLIDSTTSNMDFQFSFNTNARGVINGSWQFGGNPAFLGSAYVLVFNTGTLVEFKSGSSLVCRNGGGADGMVSNLFFRNGSLLLFDQNGGASPVGTYEANSTIRIIGNTTVPTNLAGSPPDVGNVEYDCPGLTPANVNLGLINANIKGYFKIQNTNNKVLSLVSNPGGTPTTTIAGNLEVSGTSSVAIANNTVANNLQVNGNFVQTGGTFSIQNNNSAANTTKMLLRGNFTQSAGTFTTTSIAVNNASNLFVLEMNGTTAQTISASSGSIDNANNQVALRLNNPNHVTLNSPLAVGRMNFVSGNLITTNTNLLTLNNTANNPIDISGVSASSFIAGPIKRKTSATTAYLFPVGKAGKYRFCEVIPATAAASEYRAEYFDTGYPDLSVTAPLTGGANNYYWDITRVSGSAAAIRLTLSGAVSGATATDALVVARYNGVDWMSEKGSTGNSIIPGTATSGSATSQSLPSFSPFTFGYGPSGALPIKLQYFSAQKENGYNTIRWKADCFSTRAVFEPEHSYDGKQFTKMTTIEADQLRCLQPFDYKDINNGQGTIYYRMRVIDVDGASFYSRVVAIVGRSSGFEIVGIYPTLVTSAQLKVNVAVGNGNKAEFNITNASGQVVKKLMYVLNSGENIFTLNLEGLPAGVYHLSGYNSEGLVRTFRFIKQ